MSDETKLKVDGAKVVAEAMRILGNTVQHLLLPCMYVCVCVLGVGW